MSLPTASELRAIAEASTPVTERRALIEKRIAIEAAAGHFGHAFLRTHFQQEDFQPFLAEGFKLSETDEHFTLTW
jgi:hypothetical protein